MQHKRFDYSPKLKTLPLLIEEIANFKYHLTPSGHTGFDAEIGEHDDLICAVCIPLIISELVLKEQATCGTVVPIPKTSTDDPFNRKARPRNFDYRWYN